MALARIVNRTVKWAEEPVLSHTFIFPHVFNTIAMAEGTVTYFDSDGGYGFIDTDESEDDVFFHMADTDFEDDLDEGEDVVFDITQGDKGPRAENLERDNQDD